MAWRRGKGGRRLFRGATSPITGKNCHCSSDPDSGVWDTYGCPPGSLLVFSEAVRHTSCVWRQDEPRMALFYAYNHINVRHHKPGFTDEMLHSLSPEHRRFFSEVYHPQFDGDEWKRRLNRT